jgi:hypothetical protein
MGRVPGDLRYAPRGNKMAKIQLTIPDWLDKICAWPVMAYRKHKYGYAYRRINLGEGEWTILDQEDYYWLNHYKWSVVNNDKKMYAVRIIRKEEFGKIKPMFLHREIMQPAKGLLVDHRNSDGLDNRRSNLRPATHSQNSYNRAKKKNTSSQFNGVSWTKGRNRWRVSIRNNGKSVSLGYFDNEIDAAKAYDMAAKKYHGEFARLNFPD